MFGPNKRVVNAYLRALVGKHARVLVIDTPLLGSAKCLMKVVGRKKVHVCGTAPGLARAARRAGIQHCAEGWSALALFKWRRLKFDLIFLDYCGTPDPGPFCVPEEELARASTMLTPGGVLAATFSKRCAGLMTKCVDMAPPRLGLQRAYEYCDTSAMAMVAYSAVALPKVAQALGLHRGAVVRVGKWLGRVDKVCLHRLKLTHVRRSQGQFVDVSEGEAWEEPIAAVVCK